MYVMSFKKKKLLAVTLDSHVSTYMLQLPLTSFLRSYYLYSQLSIIVR